MVRHLADHVVELDELMPGARATGDPSVPTDTRLAVA
jgi:hypothetical protein